MEMRSPAVSSMSSSRPAGWSVICAAWSSSSSVVSPIAETTTTTSSPFSLAATNRSATRLMCAAEATDEPPYFWTTRATGPQATEVLMTTVVASLTVEGCDHRVDDPERWLLTAEERGNPATSLPAWTEGNLAVPLVHGATYFDRLVECVEALDGGDHLFFTDWRGEPPQRPPPGRPTRGALVPPAGG